MTRWDRLRKRWLRFVHGQTVPGVRPAAVSVTAHLLALAIVVTLFVIRRSAPVIVLPGIQNAQRIPLEPVTLPPSGARSRLQIAQKQARRPRPKPPVAVAESTTDVPGLQALRQQAHRETTAIIQNFKFRTLYGFSPFPKYELAFQIAGTIPRIGAEDLPAHFEQYVIVEVTIDTNGHVADARIVAGEVDSKIQQTLLAAVREFLYRPATREGIPIPSQSDIVVHIPT